MQKIKCIIIEDEPLAAKLLSDYVQQVPCLELCQSFKEALSAGSYLQNEKTELIFLDIHLPKLKGLSFLRTLQNPPAIIITTAYQQYAVEGFELSVVDYLLKPFSLERFIAAVNKTYKLLRPNQSHKQSELKKETCLFLTIDRKRVRIDYDKILYIESRREYVKVFTLLGEHTSKISTTELQSLLPNPRFTRIHRSFIVATDKIDNYTKSEVEIKGKRIPVGKGYRYEETFLRIDK